MNKESGSEGKRKKNTAASAVEYPTEWVGEKDDAVMLGPAECRTAWRQFEADTAYAVSQALAAKEAAARGGQPAAPLWMIVALIITGFDEVMWLLRNPITLLFLVGFGLFLRALYQNLDVETAMAMGVVPGLMFLGTKVVPTAVMILKKLVDEGSAAQVGGGGNSTTTTAEGAASDALDAGREMKKKVSSSSSSPSSAVKSAGSGAKDKVYTPSVSGEGVKLRKPAAMMYPGGADDDR